MIQKFCVPNPDDRCTQCRCRNVLKNRKRGCSVYRGMQKQWPEVFERLQQENVRPTDNNTHLREELTAANRRLFVEYAHPPTSRIQ